MPKYDSFGARRSTPGKPASKPIIAVDVDDVLAATAEEFVNFSNKRWGTNLTPDDFDEHWAQMWKVDYEEEARRREHIVKAKVYLKPRFFNEAKPVLEKLSRDYKLVIVSSRGPGIRGETIAWLETAFGTVFSEYHFAKIWEDLKIHTKVKIKMTKGELLNEIGANYLIDDQPKHCKAAAKAGIIALLFGNYRWVKQAKLAPGMVRVKDWQEVEEYFDAQK